MAILFRLTFVLFLCKTVKCELKQLCFEKETAAFFTRLVLWAYII